MASIVTNSFIVVNADGEYLRHYIDDGTLEPVFEFVGSPHEAYQFKTKKNAEEALQYDEFLDWFPDEECTIKQMKATYEIE